MKANTNKPEAAVYKAAGVLSSMVDYCAVRIGSDLEITLIQSGWVKDKDFATYAEAFHYEDVRTVEYC